MSKPDQTMKPCPMCGMAHPFLLTLLEPATETNDGAGTITKSADHWSIVCDARVGGCGCSGPSCSSEDGAIAAWNRRAVPALVQLEPIWNESTPALTQDELVEIAAFLEPSHDGSDFEPECPGCTAYRKVKAMLAASPSASQPEPSLYQQSNGPAMVSEALRTIGDIASASLTPPAPEASGEKFDREDVEAVADCLGDDAAQLRDENDEDERADNMDRAASMLTWMLLTHPAYAAPVPSPEPREPVTRTLTQREVDAIYALRHADEWIGSAPHGDNCFVSDHYEGDPGARCNCGKDSVQQAINEALCGYPESMDEDGEPLQVFAAVPAAPPSLPETVTDAQWMAEFVRLANDLAGAAFRHGYACRSREDDAYNEAMDAEVESKDAARRKAGAALLAHIGKRPAMSEAQLTADELEQLQRVDEEFADCGETEVPYEALMEFARRGYLRCERFAFTDIGATTVRAALSTAPAQPTTEGEQQ